MDPTAPVTTATETETSVSAEPAAAVSPPVPSKPDLATELTEALENAGLQERRGLANAKHLKAPKQSQEEDTAGSAKPADPKTAAAKDAPAKPVTQSSLSAGFAKLNRQTKDIERREAALPEREAASKSERDAIAKEREAWHAEQKAKLDELALLDADPLAFIEKYAARKQVTVQAVYDRWLGRVLNDGKLRPEDAVADTKAELDGLKKTLAERDAESKKAAEEAKAEADKKAAEAALAARFEREKQEFVKIISTSDLATECPLLAQEIAEDAAAVAEIALKCGQDYYVRTKKAATVEMVAKHLEEQLRFAAWQEEQAKAKTPAAPVPAKAAAPKAASKAAPKTNSTRETGAEEANPEAVVVPGNGLRRATGPKTLTHNMAVQRSGLRASAPVDDNERLDRALQHWPS